MIPEVQGAFFLMLSLVCFVIIIGLLTLGLVMKPGRWSERERHVG